jgi:tetratricopeptide (TPR) repeat protein
LWKRLVQRYSDVPGFKNDLAGLYTLGGIVQMDGYDDPEKALSLFQQSRQLQEELVEHYPGDANRTNFRKELAVAYGNLGDASRRLGQPARALDFYRRSNRIHRDLARENPKNISFAYDLAQSCLELGKIHQALGHAADALKDCAEAQKHYQELTSESGNLNYRIELAEAYDQLGGIRFAQGEFAKALDDHWQALKIRDRLVRKHGEEGAARLNDSARWLARIGEHAQAMAAVNQMSRHKNLSGVTIFEAAAICAVCSAKARARRDHEYAPADRDKLADQYAVAGLVLLKRAHAAGYFKDSDALKRMREDRDFAALRSRADFKVLLRAIEQSVGATGN